MIVVLVLLSNKICLLFSFLVSINSYSSLLIMLVYFFDNDLCSKFLLAYMEKHDTHTGCQVAIFYKALFYLTLNMLIIPALTLATAGIYFEIKNFPP